MSDEKPKNAIFICTLTDKEQVQNFKCLRRDLDDIRSRARNSDVPPLTIVFMDRVCQLFDFIISVDHPTPTASEGEKK